MKSSFYVKDPVHCFLKPEITARIEQMNMQGFRVILHIHYIFSAALRIYIQRYKNWPISNIFLVCQVLWVHRIISSSQISFERFEITNPGIQIVMVRQEAGYKLEITSQFIPRCYAHVCKIRSDQTEISHRALQIRSRFYIILKLQRCDGRF
jgi:hypothetical protein